MKEKQKVMDKKMKMKVKLKKERKKVMDKKNEDAGEAKEGK